MTSTYRDLIRDFKVGKNQGEDVVQTFFYDKYGIITTNVGKQNLGWDLEVAGIDGSKIGVDETTFEEERFLGKFKKQFGNTFEVKRDQTSDQTQNIYWECWSNARISNPGCMLTCKADTIVFVRKVEFIFLDRDKFLSWVFENLFLRTTISDEWRTTTFKGGKEQMMPAKSNHDVRGILMPIKHIKTSPACIFTEKRTT